MDMRDPIKTLKILLEKKIGMNLSCYEVYLQNVPLYKYTRW